MEAATPSARERILDTAHDLFYSEGIRATGVDRLIAESGVAKLTFYRHFPSKDDLVRAFLDHRHGRWMAWFVDALGRHGGKAGGGLAPLVPVLGEWFASPGYRGCAFINAVAEVGGMLPDTVDIARRHKEEMTGVIAELLPEGPEREARALAAALAVDGAIVRAQAGESAAALAGLEKVARALA